ncbi:MAG: type IV secretion protein IcmT [Alphaproteobacteria bacterium]|nr:type IV secretion protein IcmT [Alphaproteobacteria bacterium]
MAKNQVQDMQDQVNWHWRNSMRPVRFFAFDARAAVSFLFLLVYFRMITFIFAILSTFAFYMLEKYGLTFNSAMRRFRSYLAGNKRPALMSFGRRRMKDFG